ncbi:MAG TPA: N-formylglutamate amidohydrolase [Myxococcota bacterium]|nr:N-formylglutamate amidohydrolase [Myxococcota bacterium]
METHLLRGPTAPEGPARLLVELPHGATETAHYDHTRAQLRGSFPEGLSDFFHVNTDIGTPELALALARELIRRDPSYSVLIVRALIPRTFIDVNRMLGQSREAYKAGGVTPGVPPYVRESADLHHLEQLYWSYQEVALAAFAEVCGAGGQALMLHSYAPRTVDVEVDDQIVQSLRAAYEPERVGQWPLRPEVDLIGRAPDGSLYADAEQTERLRLAFDTIGLSMKISATYPLHPSTMAYHHAMRYPGRTLCLEIRRDLLADPFDPFVQMHISPEKVARLVGALAAGWR